MAVCIHPYVRMQEAYAICQEVLAESPNDDAVIHPLRLTLVRLGRGTRPSAALSPPRWRM